LLNVILTSKLLSQFDWMEHGFGSRSAALSQDEMSSLKQIHSAITLSAETPGCIGEGDALVTSTAGLAVSIRTADCYPIFLVDPRQRAVAAIHAGWRGTAAQIALVAMEKMNAHPPDIHVAIGPGIGACCYEVGEDVAKRFGYAGAGKIDLAAANRAQLLEAGVAERNIDILGECTLCTILDGEPRYHSFRRDKDDAGRMISYIRIR
jgi:polyphenol oxidase